MFKNIKHIIKQIYKTFFYILFILCVVNVYVFSQQAKFKHLTIQNGLSNNKVFTVIQDQTGFIWFGTNDGLNRYDGYQFKIFRHNSADSNSISDNSIKALLEDRQGNIWIGTQSGILNKYDHITEKFTEWELIKSDISVRNSILSIYEDNIGNIWIGTDVEGLYRLNPENNTINHWIANPNKVNSLSNNFVTSIIEDNFGNIIIGTFNGLNIFNPDKPQNGFKTFYHKVANLNSLSNNVIFEFSKSSINSNMIFIGTLKGITKYNSKNSTFTRIEIANPNNIQYGISCHNVIDEITTGKKIMWVNSYGGLIRLNFTSGKTTRFIHNKDNRQSLINNQINKIIKDRSGIIWTATEGGVSYRTSKSIMFNSFDLNYDDDNIISILNKKNITAISKFDDDRIWIGTTDGLYLLSNINTVPQVRRITKFNGYYIWSLASISRTEIWVGTYGDGLKQFNYVKNKITNWDLNVTKYYGQSIFFNKSLLKDSKRNIWIGYQGAGLAKLNPKTGNYRIWTNEPGNTKSLSYDIVGVIKEDRLGRIWIGTKGGVLNLFEDKEGGIFHHWLQTGNSKYDLGTTTINTICEAKKSKTNDNSKTILWIGTSNGLNRFEIKNNKVRSDIYDIDVKIDFYTIRDGLPDNSVNSIMKMKKETFGWVLTQEFLSTM